jgi:OmpA-OmpF porin, OOP family
MKKIITAIACATLASSAFAAAPAAQEPFYMGVSFGESKIDTEITARAGDRLDETDNSFKIFGGMKINSIFSVEAQYADFGTVSYSGSGLRVSADTNSFGVAGIAGYNINSQVRPYAKVGLHYWDSDATARFNGASASDSDSGTDIFYGAGVEFSFNKKWAARLEVENYDADGTDIRLLSVGLSYKF